MKEGKIEIYLSYKEPLYKESILWLRPFLDKEGYELLYYGSKGWTPLCFCDKKRHCVENVPSIDGNDPSCDPDNNVTDIDKDSYPDSDCMEKEEEATMGEVQEVPEVQEKPETVSNRKPLVFERPCNCK